MAKYRLREEGILEYADKFKGIPPKKILAYLGRMRNFIYKHMTSQGRRALRIAKPSNF